MEYANFYEKITLRHHIIFEDWPIARFCTPGNLGLLELRTLYQALLDEKPLFRRVPDDEWNTLDLAEIRRRYNSFSPTVAQPLRLDDEDDDDPTGGEPSGSAGGERSGPSSSEQFGSAGGASEQTGHVGGEQSSPAPEPSGSSPQQGVGAQSSSTSLDPPPRGGIRVSLTADGDEAPKKQRKKRAGAGMTRQEWAIKKAEIEAEKKAARQAQLEKARNYGRLTQGSG